MKELIYKKGFANIDKQKVPLTDNNMIEKVLLDCLVSYPSFVTSYEERKTKMFKYTAQCDEFLFFSALQELGKFNIICLEDIVHEVANVGPHFKEVMRFLWPFMLNKPAGGLTWSKKV